MARERVPEPRLLVSGNAAIDGQADNRYGWFAGHFIDQGHGLRSTTDVEVKWGIHPAGEAKAGVAHNTVATTLSILITGDFTLDFPELGTSVHFTQPGDYALWAPGVAHSWQAQRDSVVLTVRWPSLPNDQKSRST